MSGEQRVDSLGSADRRVPDEGSLLHVTPDELLGRLVELGYTGRCLFYVGALEGEVGLYEGQIVDARALGDFGPPALFRMLGAVSGSYRLDRRVTESAPPQSFAPWPDLVQQHRAHRAKLARAAEAVGGLEQVWSVRPLVLKRHLDDLPDQINPLLRRVDGRRTVAQVITEAPLEERLTVRALARLLSLGVLALPDVVADESGPVKSPLSSSLAPEASDEPSEPMPVIGSDLPVRRQWFDDARHLEEEREQVRKAVMDGSLPPLAAEAQRPEGEPPADELLPPSDPDGEPVMDPPGDTARDGSLAGAGPRPLPRAPDVVEAAAQDGQPGGVSLTTWSSQGEPPPLFVGEEITSDDHRVEIDRWLGQESSFFSTSPTEMDDVELVREPPPPPLPKEPSARVKLLAAAALLVVGALVGYLVGQGFSAPPAAGTSDAPSSVVPAAAAPLPTD